MPADDSPRWQEHDAAWRDPAQVTSHWENAVDIDLRLLQARASRGWWDVLAAAGVTLIITREYEHLVVAMTGSRRVSFLTVPHPSGVAIDLRRGRVHLASTRNPNELYELVPARDEAGTLVPLRSRFLPGSLYLHDLALIGDRLHGCAVGHNAIVSLSQDDGYRSVWWPRAVEVNGKPDFSKNYLQLNSIAAGGTVERSFFSASAETISSRRPGHRNFPVDRRGVIFDGASREPVARGLTRPHSARLSRRRLWVDNSGYGELGVIDDGRFEPLVRLPGWTRGLAFHGDVAFVGTSRVIPRFHRYAPGLDLDRSVCGVHAVDTRSGRVLGSYVWPNGNQIFAVDWIPSDVSAGLPLRVGVGRSRRATAELFYRLETADG